MKVYIIRWMPTNRLIGIYNSYEQAKDVSALYNMRKLSWKHKLVGYLS